MRTAQTLRAVLSKFLCHIFCILALGSCKTPGGRMDWIVMGLLLIMLGILFIAIGVLSTFGSETHSEGAFVLLIGPFPVVLASSTRAALVGLLAAVFFLLVVVLWLRQ
ncbi:MAG TPA: DUF131 domain-containing protein [Euryarchaeota archaeon]|nr:DUF131 domain-containing protein [Euryarchaeota archaeon]